MTTARTVSGAAFSVAHDSNKGARGEAPAIQKKQEAYLIPSALKISTRLTVYIAVRGDIPHV